MSNNTFNIKRFALLAKKDMVENWKYNLFFALTMFAVMVIIASYTTRSYLEDKNTGTDIPLHDNLLMMATVFFVFAFMFYISRMMQPMSSKKRRINFLMLPASSLEKFLVRFIPATIGFVVVFFLCFKLADFARILLGTMLYPDVKFHIIELSSYLVSNKEAIDIFDLYIFLVPLSVLALIFSLFVFGATFWQKNVFIKSFLSITSIVVILTYMSHKLCIYLSVGDSYYGNAFLHPKIFFEHITLSICIYTFMAIFFCVLAYFRFKESEYIDRK